MNSSDALQIQRLVDGECDEAELRSLLLDAENQPDGWRQIATAFVEDKFWQTQFRRTGTRNDDSQSVLTGQEHDILEQTVNQQKSSAQLSRSFHPQVIRWLTMAAGLLLAVSFGYLLGTDQAQPVPGVPLVANHQEVPTGAGEEIASSPTPMPKITPASLKPEYHLQLPEADNPSNGVAFDSEIPLYYVQSREQLKQIEEPDHDRFQLAPEVLVQLADQGFQTRQDLNFISGNLKDGRSFMIPVRTINFSPGQ
jgi:hypothetical protein